MRAAVVFGAFLRSGGYLAVTQRKKAARSAGANVRFGDFGGALVRFGDPAGAHLRFGESSGAFSRASGRTRHHAQSTPPSMRRSARPQATDRGRRPASVSVTAIRSRRYSAWIGISLAKRNRVAGLGGPQPRLGHIPRRAGLPRRSRPYAGQGPPASCTTFLAPAAPVNSAQCEPSGRRSRLGHTGRDPCRGPGFGPVDHRARADGTGTIVLVSLQPWIGADHAQRHRPRRHLSRLRVA